MLATISLIAELALNNATMHGGVVLKLGQTIFNLDIVFAAVKQLDKADQWLNILRLGFSGIKFLADFISIFMLIKGALVFILTKLADMIDWIFS